MENNNAHLLIIGKGNLYSDLINEIKSKKMEERISIIESVPYEKIPEYYKTADIFTLAYDPNQEGLPMPVMEAMAAGIPVIIPKSTDSIELDGSVIFAERNMESFSQKINQLLENKNRRDEYGLKGLQNSKNFDISKLEKRESEIYEELIKNEKFT